MGRGHQEGQRGAVHLARRRGGRGAPLVPPLSSRPGTLRRRVGTYEEALCRLALLGVCAGPVGPNYCPADAEVVRGEGSGGGTVAAVAALRELEAAAVGPAGSGGVVLSQAALEVLRRALLEQM